MAAAYTEVIATYERKGYIRRVPADEKPPPPEWLIPHFAMLRPDKATTKLRVVFDASTEVRGISLNGCLHQGPKLQNELFFVLMQFRCYVVALILDVTEMYLQVLLLEDERGVHRFLW